MKKGLVIVLVFVFALGGGWSIRLQLQLRGTTAEVANLERALDAAQIRALDVSNEIARIEIEQASLRSAAASHARRKRDSRARSVVSDSAPHDATPDWSATNEFCWIQKNVLISLGLPGFRAADSPARAMAPEVMRLLNRVGRSFAETHPQFGSLADLSPDEATRLTAEYKQSLADAALSLDESDRPSVAAMLAVVDQIPVPGRMAQPPTEYQLHEDAATVLGLTEGERDAVQQATRDMVQRFQALERLHVSLEPASASGPHEARSASFSFMVSSFPTEGQELKRDWVEQLNATIGHERTKYLLAMSDNWISSDLGSFGEAERTVTFEERPGHYGIQERSSKGYSNNSGTSGPASIPAGWRHLIVRPPNGGPPALREF